MSAVSSADADGTLQAVLWGSVAVGMALVAYYQVLGIYFAYDDFFHLYHHANQRSVEFVFQPFGGHLCILPNLIWTTLVGLFGPNPVPCYQLMLVSHLAAVGLLFGIVRRVTGSSPWAALAAGSWGASPINVGTLGWYSVYGEVLALVLALSGLLLLVRAVARGGIVARSVLGWGSLFVGAAMSFGVGLGLAVVFPLLVWTLVPAAQRTRPALWCAMLPPIVVTALYLTVLRTYGGPTGLEVATPQVVPFLTATLGMLAGLITFGAAIVMLGPASMIGPQFPRVVPFLAGGFWLLVVVGWWHAEGRVRRVMAGLLIATLCQYVMVALGRAALYRMVGMTGAQELRYHYAPAAMLAAIAAIALHAIMTRVAAGARADVPAVLLAGAMFVVGRSPVAINLQAGGPVEVATFKSQINALARCRPPGEPLFIENRVFPPFAFFPELFPGWAAAFTIYFPQNVVAGHPVYFIDPNPKVLDAARAIRDSRIATLLLSPAEALMAGASEPLCSG